MALEDFKSTPWREITEEAKASGEKWIIERHVPDDLDHRLEIRSGHVGSMGHDAWNSELTPREYWHSHVDGWLSAAALRTNIHVLKYEDLLASLDETMGKVAAFLGVEKSSFTDVTERVSMHSVGREDEHR